VPKPVTHPAPVTSLEAAERTGGITPSHDGHNLSASPVRQRSRFDLLSISLHRLLIYRKLCWWIGPRFRRGDPDRTGPGQPAGDKWLLTVPSGQGNHFRADGQFAAQSEDLAMAAVQVLQQVADCNEFHRLKWYGRPLSTARPSSGEQQQGQAETSHVLIESHSPVFSFNGVTLLAIEVTASNGECRT